MLSDDVRRIVRATLEHAQTWSDGDDHTVAGGLLTASGRIVLGMNTYHFLGGPCGEVAALSQHAATAPDDPIVAVAAAFGPTASVIPPCGKCRQIVHDLSPEILFVVRDANGLVTRTARELLPFAYGRGDARRLPRVHMWEGYDAAIRSGAKRQTVRVDDPFRPGPAEIVIEKGDGENVTLPATVTEVRATRRDELTEDDAIRDGFATLDDLHAALDTHYPGLGPASDVDVVTFELTGDA